MHGATNRKSVTLAVAVATFLTAMDSTVVSTAMPTIISELGGIKLMSWVFAVYLLTAAVATPIYGKLADLFGRKIIFTIGTSIFLLGSILSGAAHTMDQLIWFRAFQGLGAGGVMPITITIIGDIYSFDERAKMQGLFSAIWGIAGIAGPLVGGFFVDLLSWRWIFYVNLPIGIISIILVYMFLQEHFEKKQKKIDYFGVLLFSISMTSMLYALISGGQIAPWSSLLILSLFGISIVTLFVFIWVEKQSKEPMLPLHLFRLRVISVSNLAGFLSSAILIGLNVYLPMWIQGIKGHSATIAGLTLMPLSIGWPIGATIGGRLMLRMGTRTTSVLGMAAILAGSSWLAFIAISTPTWQMWAIMVIAGLGFGFSMTAFTVVVQSAVEWNLRGVATGSLQFLRTLGQTVGIAVFGTLFNQTASSKMMTNLHVLSSSQTMNQLLNPKSAGQIPKDIQDFLRHVMVGGLHSVFLGMVIISFIGLVVTFWLPNQTSARQAIKTT